MRSMNRTVAAGLTFLAAASGLGLSACDTAPKTADDKSALNSEVQGALGAFRSTDTTLDALLGKSAGYAVFPSVGKAGFIAGGAYGRGEVFSGRGVRLGWADMTQGTVGLQIGAQSYDMVIVFMTQEQLNKFMANQFTFTANVSAVAIKPGAAAASDISKGVVVFTRTSGGVMAEAALGGQNFTFKPL